MTNLQNLPQIKERILAIIQARGPVLPVQIASMINVSPMFSSVFLSELYEDRKIKMSNMKVGSSSLYYIAGQEAQLENFIEYLNQREKDAFLLIKKSNILEETKLSPVMRVALNAIKDFASPVKINVNGETKAFWRYSLLPDSEIKEKIEFYLNPQKKEKREKKEEEKPKEEDKIKETGEAAEKPKELQTKNEPEEKPKEKEKKKLLVKPSEFCEKVKDYLTAKDIEILSSLLESKKEFAAKIRIDTLFGKQEFYLVAKDKKKIKEEDIALALQKAQAEKMPALILAPGDIDKKAAEHAKLWRNLFKFEKVKF